MASENKDVVILQLKIEEGTGKKLPEQKKEVEALSGSIVGLSQANKKLREERNRLDTATEAGRKRIAEINEVLDRNSKIIKENSSALEKQRLNVGNYTKSIKEALANSGELGAATVGLTDNFGKLLNPITASIAGLGSLIALYAKSTTGARDFAYAQSRVVNIMNQVVEAFGKLVGGADGGGGQGPFSKLIDHAFNFIKVSTPLSLVFRKQIKDLEDTSRAAAEASERLKELEISRAFLQGDFKNSEREAELQRRIRDDTTKTLDERIAASIKIDQIMATAGQRATIVIQAQIDAIKQSTVNYDNNREAQLKVAQLMAEISDVQEDVIGKTTENTTAVANLRREYDELQKTLDRQSELEQRRREADIQSEVEYYDAKNTNRTAAEEAEEAATDRSIKRLNNYIKKRTETSNAEIKANQAEAASLGNVTDKKIQMYSMIGSTIGQLAGKNKALAIASVIIEKAAAIAGIISNTALANLKAVAVSPLTLGQPWVGINTATGIAAGVAVAAQAAKSVSDISSFEQGGTAWLTDKKYANGGRYFNIGGRPHSQGGTKFYGEDGSRFEAEKDEGLFIMKKSANKEYLSSLNVAHGGKSWSAQPSWYAAQGGQIETRALVAREFNARSMERAMTTALKNIDFYVRVDDINNSQEVGRDLQLKARVID